MDNSFVYKFELDTLRTILIVELDSPVDEEELSESVNSWYSSYLHPEWEDAEMAAEIETSSVSSFIGDMLCNDGFPIKEVREQENLGLFLYKAVKASGKYKEVERMIGLGANVNYRYMPEDYDYRPLHMAAYNADMKKVTMLVEAGCELNPVSVDGKTPLDLAMERHKRSDVVKYLVSHGGEHGTGFGKSFDELLKDAEERSESTNKADAEIVDFVKE